MASRKRSMSNDSDVSALYKEYDEASCPICMDHPHNAVLLICSSFEKGCRPYTCDTSYRHSNCLDRFKKFKEENADTSSPPSLAPQTTHDADNTSSRNPESTTSTNNYTEDLGESSMEKSGEGSNLRCPLCRGIVFGWKVLEDARKYLNLKPRSCSRESCSFSGNYRELRRHARIVHPTVCPGDVDPTRERAWRRLEDQREYNDIVSAVHSAMPGAIVLGDYVIENGGDRLASVERGGGGGGENRRLLSTLFLFQMIGSMDRGGGRSRVMLARHRRGNGNLTRRRYLWGENLLGLHNDDDEEEEEEQEEDEEEGDNEPDLNMLSDLGDDVRPNPRRRRRLARAPSEEDQQ